MADPGDPNKTGANKRNQFVSELREMQHLDFEP